MLTKENQIERLTGIGASEIAAVAGLSPWASPLDVYERKVAPVAVAESEDMERGNRLELALLDWTAARANLIVRPNETLTRHPDHPFVIATPDGYGHEPGDVFRAVCVVEVKSPGRTQGDWTDPAEDPQGYPDYYAVQVAWQMLATGLPRGILSALVWGKLWCYCLEASAELQAALLERGEDFWRKVQARDPSELDMRAGDAATIGRLIRQTDAGLVSPPDLDAAVELVRAYQHAAGVAKAAEVEAEEAKARLCQMIGPSAGLDLGAAGPRVTFKQAKDSEIVNWEDVARAAGADPELIAAHTVIRPGSRRFLVSDPRVARAKKEG